MSQSVAPYQATAVVADSATCPGGQCQFTFPTVPAGKRLRVFAPDSTQHTSLLITLVGELHPV